MHYGSLVINARRFLQDRGVEWSNLDFGLLIDEGAKLLQNELAILKVRSSHSIVANQKAYTLASNVLRPSVVEYSQANCLYPVRGETLDQMRAHKLPLYQTIPRNYTHLDDDQTIWLQPAPNTAADTTTLNGNITAADTTITVVSTDSFYDLGKIIIDSEVIEYTGKTSTTFTGCVRGSEGTTAATHTSTTTVTERDLLIYGIRRWQDREMSTFYTTGTVAATKGSPTLTGTTTAWTTGTAGQAIPKAGDYFGFTTNATTIDPVAWYKIASVGGDTAITLATNFLEATVSVAAGYIICSPNPFPNQYDGFFRAYLIAQALEKDGSYKEAASQWAKVERFIADARAGQRKPDTVIFPHGRHDRHSGDVGRMRVSGGDEYGIV